MSARLLIIAMVLGAMTLSACGKRGTLQRPDPMWGSAAEAEDVEAAPEGEDDDSNADRTRPYSTSKPLDPAQTDVPIREAPVGGPSDPYGTPNGGPG